MFKMVASVALAAVLTALWAIQNRTMPFKAVVAAFVLVGAAAAVYLVASPKEENITVGMVLRAALLLASYQLALFAAFQMGAKLTQAAVNLNVVVILVVDALISGIVPKTSVLIAVVVQIIAAAHALRETL